MIKMRSRAKLGLAIWAIVGTLCLGTAPVAHADDQATRIVVGDATNFVFAASANDILDPTLCVASLNNCTTNAGQWTTMLQTPFDASSASNTTLIAETSAITAVLTGNYIPPGGTIFVSGAGVKARVLVDCSVTNAVPCDPTKNLNEVGGPTAANLLQPGEIFLDQMLRAAIYFSDLNAFIAEASLSAGARAFNFYKVGLAGQRRVHNVVFQVRLDTGGFNALGVSGSAALVGKRTMILSSIRAHDSTR
jgi:hypothetical protein